MSREEAWMETERLIEHAKSCHQGTIAEMKQFQSDCRELMNEHRAISVGEGRRDDMKGGATFGKEQN